MSEVATLTAETVAQFLQDNPAFFDEHADIFATLTVPHPHARQTLSLGERQILTLRTRNKELEWKLSELMHNANSNEAISDHVTLWCTRMLAEPDAQRLPQRVVDGLRQEFDMLEVALRLWNLPALKDERFLSSDDMLQAYVGGLQKPYCGQEGYLPAHSWFDSKPGSVAMVPLTHDNRNIGVLVFAAEGTEHFKPDMGTIFLEILGKLASASLSRLHSAA
ncbi:hypothetical protein W822_09820 [Advenella kashmirensis W13003]|uniref:3'-5'-bisphosphate nucleotidase n=1 Tax=Advenella kashmirensis W13003 TaxID=1424334 RepID=V8QVS8_9BURK|nr:DUF484 family protein [Advenella kashmirensis]ETF03094.1 hypothetical protein W822_09820 [Advenella kashmirensis W13003]